MKKFYSSIINLKDKELNWKNQNYCYATTIFVVIMIFVLSNILSSKIYEILITNSFWNCFLMSLYPNFSMIMFGAVSLYLERKYGSLNYLLVVLMCLPIANIVNYSFEFLQGSNLGWAGSMGFSCMAFLMTGIFVIDFIFSFKHHLKDKLSLIFPIIIIIICIIFMCINLPNDITPNFHFDFFGRLVENCGHYGPFIFGVIMRLLAFLFCKDNNKIL